MQVSAIMNIHELAVNRTVKQKADAQMRKGQKEVENNALQPTHLDVKDKQLKGVRPNTVQQSDKKEEIQSESFLIGNAVDIRT